MEPDLSIESVCLMEQVLSQPATGNLAWYCARTQPKHEQIAAGCLKSRLGLEVFHPRLRMERATVRGPVKVVEPLFPGYLFVRCELEQRLDDIRYANGISSVVHFGQKIPAIPDAVVEDLRRCFEDEEPMAVEDRLVAGASVTVAAGAFMGSQGVVVRVLPARQRVQILLDFLGRTTLTEVERKSLSVDERSLADLMPALSIRPGQPLVAA